MFSGKGFRTGYSSQAPVNRAAVLQCSAKCKRSLYSGMAMPSGSDGEIVEKLVEAVNRAFVLQGFDSASVFSYRNWARPSCLNMEMVLPCRGSLCSCEVHQQSA
jgi:hypothetical protein